MQVVSKKNPVIIFEAVIDEASGKVLLEEVKHTDGTPIEEPQIKIIALSTFKRLYRDINEGSNSMRVNRAGRSGKAKPFIPTPYRLRQSMISSFLQCPNKFYATYEDGYSESSIFTQMGTAIHGIMEDIYDGENTKTVDELFQLWWSDHGPSDLSLYEEWRVLMANYFKGLEGKTKPNIIARELEFTGNIRNIPISGTIDRIDRVDDNTIMIVDYKTNMMPYTAEELRGSIQFKFYSLAVQQLKDQLGEFDRVICAYEMMRTGNRQYVEYSAEELEIYADWLEVIWAKMLSGKDRDPKINKYCGYCQRREQCPAYASFLENPLEFAVNPVDDMAQALTRLKESAKILKGRIDELESALKDSIIEAGGPVQIGGRTWSLQTSQRVTYPYQKVVEKLRGTGFEESLIGIMPNLSASTIKKLKLPDYITNELETIKQVGFTSPSLKSIVNKEEK